MKYTFLLERNDMIRSLLEYKDYKTIRKVVKTFKFLDSNLKSLNERKDFYTLSYYFEHINILEKSYRSVNEYVLNRLEELNQIEIKKGEEIWKK